MPELAEVEFFRRQWDPGLGSRITSVDVHPEARVFRGVDANKIARRLSGRRFLSSHAHGKNLLFRFSGGVWLSCHLGMTGRLWSIDSRAGAGSEARLHRPGSPAEDAPRHHHLVLHQRGRRLVFSDPRMFGRIVLRECPDVPEWWSSLPPEILSPAFTRTRLAGLLARRGGSPIKAVLLDQDIFPGIGNWMADEILWRTRTDPSLPAARLGPDAIGGLWRAARRLCRDALRIIGTDWGRPPESWLFNHRWIDNQRCPRPECGAPLSREVIAGRTTCWCPTCQEGSGGRREPPVDDALRRP